mgnify:CR=1 FL=1
MTYENEKVLIFGIEQGYTYEVLTSVKNKYNILYSELKIEKSEKTWKKSLTFPEMGGILSKLSRDGDAKVKNEVKKQKKFWKTWKKFLTSAESCAKI